jgi:hypothetical protein
LTADQFYLFRKFIMNLIPCQFDFHFQLQWRTFRRQYLPAGRQECRR